MSEYNLKVEKFANGETKISYYSRPIKHNIFPWEVWWSYGHGMYFHDSTNDVDYMVADHFVKSPFDGAWITQYEYEKSYVKLAPKTKEEAEAPKFYDTHAEYERNLYRSLVRSKQAIYKYSRQVEWKFFVTLTFSPEVVDRTDYDACMKKAKKWFNNQKSRYAPNLKFLYVPELHKDGVSWHIHGLLADCGSMKFEDSGIYQNGKLVYNLGGWTFGFSTATEIQDTRKVSNYITKYITKEMCVRTIGKSRYHRSKNIEEPSVQEVLIDTIDDISTIEDSLGLTLKYTTQVEGFLDAEYRIYENEKGENNV